MIIDDEEQTACPFCFTVYVAYFFDEMEVIFTRDPVFCALII